MIPLALTLALDLLGADQPANSPPPGLTALFRGKDLTNWRDEGKARGHFRNLDIKEL